jgi:hypothetical protein
MAARSQRILFDENFSHFHVAFIARESRLAVFQHIRKMGWSGGTDEVWIPRAVGGAWTIVTADRNEKARGYTVADLRLMNARVLMCGRFWDNINGWSRAKWLVGNIERIVEIAASLNPGDVMLVDCRCKIKAAKESAE